jgi:hypothetical protein
MKEEKYADNKDFQTTRSNKRNYISPIKMVVSFPFSRHNKEASFVKAIGVIILRSDPTVNSMGCSLEYNNRFSSGRYEEKS